MGINIGFTGSRDGMSPAQKHKLRDILQQHVAVNDVVTFHVGRGKDSKGGDNSADMQAEAIAQELGCVIEPHPPRDSTAESLLARNREVVTCCQYLIAAPQGHREIVRSGTWMTVRHACAPAFRRDGLVIWPLCGCDTPLDVREHPVD